MRATALSPASPYAGHQVRLDYDAAGRLLARTHLGKLPPGSTDDAQRPFIAKRAFVWEGNALLAEHGLNFSGQLLWQATYVPGPTGLDDAVQVTIATYDPAGSTTPKNQTTYTILRDELGTVIGLAEEKTGADPNAPPIPARYLYTPYGEAHLEAGPELRRAQFDATLTQIQQGTTTITQTITDPTTTQAGGFRITLSIPAAEASVATSVLLEQLSPTTGTWDQVPQAQRFIGTDPAQGEAIVILPLGGWTRSATYRVRLTAQLADASARAIAQAQSFDFAIPASGAQTGAIYDRTYALEFDSAQAASNTLCQSQASGCDPRFPGGQPLLFQGLWTDPVTGIAYARSRWYSPRDASWLSEDPAGSVDSPNLFAFVAWQPNIKTDPMGLASASLERWACKVQTGQIPPTVGPPGMPNVEAGARDVCALFRGVNQSSEGVNSLVGQFPMDPIGTLDKKVRETASGVAAFLRAPVAPTLKALSNRIRTSTSEQRAEALGKAGADAFFAWATYQWARTLFGMVGAASEPGLGPGFVESPAPKVWGPHNGPGPLGGEVANTFRSATYTEEVLQEDVVLYRAMGGKAGPLSPYWSRVKPLGPLQAQLDNALLPEWGNTATAVAAIRVPAGTTIYEGVVAPQVGTAGLPSLLGGGNQVYIPRVDPAWLVKP